MKIFFIAVLFAESLSLYSQERDINFQAQSDYSYQYALIEASRQKMIGNINEAVNLYLSCIKANPDCDVAYYELGTVYSAGGENLKAENMLSEAYKIAPENYWYGIAYSELLKANKKGSKSLAVLRKMKKVNKTDNLTINFKIAEILSEEKRYGKALDVLDEIEKNYGVSELVSLEKFELYKLQKEFEKAELVLFGLIKKDPENVEYQILLAEFYSMRSDSTNALKAYENAFRVDSANIYAITNLADIYSARGNDEKAFYFLNQAFLNKNIALKSKIQTMMFLNKDREMIRNKRIFIEEMIVNLLAEYPGNTDVSTVAYDFYNGLEEHGIALTIIKSILSKVKDDYIIWQQALYTASMLENYEELIIIGKEALKYFPNKSEFYLFTGMAYFQKEEFDSAYTVLSQNYPSIKKEDKIRGQFLLFLAESAYKTGRKENAYQYYDQLVIEDPSNDFTKNNYSYYLSLDSVNLLRAKELSYSTIKNFPENSTFLDTYAWILFKLGDYKQAKIYSQKALLINGETDSDIIFHFAEILFMLGDFRSSEKYYKLAEERGYDKEIIRKKIKIVSEKL